MDAFLFVASILTGTIHKAVAKSSGNKAQSKLSTTTTSTITREILERQDASTSTSIIDHYSDSLLFHRLALYEGTETVKRDEEDASKLAQGIEFARSKGVIDPNFKPEPYVPIDVVGKSPTEVSNLILTHMRNSKSDRSVVVLVGLSGTGKGTTVSCLKKQVESSGKAVTCWSNGNIFRSVTLLAAKWCELNCKGGAFDEAKALTKENIKAFMNMLSLVKDSKGQWDTRINGMGIDAYVSQVQNTLLKTPLVSKNIPTVAKYTQGEVIHFAASAISKLESNNIFALLEGREQTVNYVRTPHRFKLILSDESLIGKRRAAQRLMASVKSHELPVDQASVEAALDKALEALVCEISS